MRTLRDVIRYFAASRMLLIMGAAVPLFSAVTTPAQATATPQECAISRAVVASETALRDALRETGSGSSDTAALRAALARLTSLGGDRPQPALANYLTSRANLVHIITADSQLDARKALRTPLHATAGQNVLLAIASTACAPDAQAETRHAAAAASESGGGNGGAGIASGSAGGSAKQPSGPGLETNPLSFFRSFDTTLHVAPTAGAALAFGALIFALTRNRRAHRRYLCHLPAILHLKRDEVASAMLDISRGGAKLSRSHDLSQGDRLKLAIPGLSRLVSARVIWANKGFIGVNFRTPLDPQEFGAVLAEARKGAGVGEFLPRQRSRAGSP